MYIRICAGKCRKKPEQEICRFSRWTDKGLSVNADLAPYHIISIFPNLPKGVPVFFQNRDQSIIICAVIAYIAMDDEIVFYRNLDIVCRFCSMINICEFPRSYLGMYPCSSKKALYFL